MTMHPLNSLRACMRWRQQLAVQQRARYLSAWFISSETPYEGDFLAPVSAYPPSRVRSVCRSAFLHDSCGHDRSRKFQNRQQSRRVNCSGGRNRSESSHISCGALVTHVKSRGRCISTDCARRSTYRSSTSDSGDTTSRKFTSNLSKSWSKRGTCTSSRFCNLSNTSHAGGHSSCLEGRGGNYKDSIRRSSNSLVNNETLYLEMESVSPRLAVFASCCSMPLQVNVGAASGGRTIARYFSGKAAGLLHCLSAAAVGVLSDTAAPAFPATAAVSAGSSRTFPERTTDAAACIEHQGALRCEAGGFNRGRILCRHRRKFFLSHAEAPVFYRSSVARFNSTRQARAFYATVMCRRSEDCAATCDGETGATTTASRPEGEETTFRTNSIAAAGRRKRRRASDASTYAAMEGRVTAAVAGKKVPDAARDGEEGTLTRAARVREGGEPACNAAAADLAAGADSATRAGRLTEALGDVNSAREAIDNSDERERHEVADTTEHVDSGELFVNPLCMQMEQLLLQCGNAEEVLTLLVSHRGVLFVKNLITALELLAEFADPSAAAEGVNVQNYSNSFSSSANHVSNRREGVSVKSSASHSTSGEGSSGRRATDDADGGGDGEDSSRDGNSSSEDGLSSSCWVIPTQESSSVNSDALVTSSTSKETDLIEQGILGRCLEGPMPRGWPRGRMSYRELFSYLNTNEESSSSDNSSSSRTSQAAWQGSTRMRQPPGASWIVRDERYEVLLDDLRLHRRTLSFDAAARVVLALRRLNHRHYGLLSAMLHPLAKRGIPMPTTAFAAGATGNISNSTRSSVFSSASSTSGAAGTAVPCKASFPLSFAGASSADAVLRISRVPNKDSDHPASSVSSQSAAAISDGCGDGNRTLRQSYQQQQRRWPQDPTDLNARIEPQHPLNPPQVARLQKRFEEVTHARMHQLLRCADVYVWAGYTQHPFFDRIVRLVSTALRPSLHQQTQSYVLAAAAAKDERDARMASTANARMEDGSTSGQESSLSSAGEMLISAATSIEASDAPTRHPAAKMILNVADAGVQPAASGFSPPAAGANVAVLASQHPSETLPIARIPVGASDSITLRDKTAPASAKHQEIRKIAAVAVAPLQLGTVLTSSPALLVDCLRVFSSLQVSHAEHAHIAATAAQLLLSNEQRLFFRLSSDETTALAAAISALPPLLHLLPCMRSPQAVVPCPLVHSQQPLDEPNPTLGASRSAEDCFRTRVLPPGGLSGWEKEQCLPQAHQHRCVVRVEHQQQEELQRPDAQRLPLQTFESQRRQMDVKEPRHEPPAMPQQQQERSETLSQQKREGTCATHMAQKLDHHECMQEHYLGAHAEGNVEPLDACLAARKSSFQHPFSVGKEDGVCHFDCAKTFTQLSSSQRFSRPVADACGAVVFSPLIPTILRSAQKHGAVIARIESEASSSSVMELMAHQTSSPVHALLWAAADRLERHFPAFSLAAIASLLSSFQRQQLLFPECILQSAARAATHLRLAANTYQRAQISVDEIGRLLHSCTFFGLAILNRPASENAYSHIISSNVNTSGSVRGRSLFPTGDSLSAPQIASRAQLSSQKGQVNAFSRRHTDPAAPKGSSTATATARAAAEQVSAAASAVAALCDSAAAYLEQHLDEITETTAIQICYALAAAKGATERHRYLLSHVYRKIGKGTAWEQHRALVFELWLSQLIQFPSLSYNMPRRCVFEGLRAWCMQRGGYGAPWPEEVAEISSLLHRMRVRHHAFSRPQRGGPYEIDILLQAPSLESTAILVTTESAKNAFEPAGSTTLQQQHLAFLAGITRVACVNRGVWKNLPTRASKVLLLVQILQWLSFWAERKSTAVAS